MPQATSTTERRKRQRKRPLGLVYVELSSVNGGMLRDLSEQGFAMRAMMPLHVGDVTPFSCSLDPGTRLEGQCKVLWVEEEGRVAGLQFTEVAAELPERIRHWLAEHFDGEAAPVVAAKPAVHEASSLKELREELRTITPGIHDAKQAPAKEVEASLETENVASEVAVPEITPIPVDATAPPEAAADVEIIKMELPGALAATPEVDMLPALEPLPDLPEIQVASEPEKMSGWLDRSMALLAVRMMLFLALVASAIVFHRPLGNAIVWLGLKIAGPSPTEVAPTPNSGVAFPPTPPAPALPSPPAAGSDTAVTPVPDSAPRNKEALPAPETAKKRVEVPPVTENPLPSLVLPPGKNAPPAALVPVPATDRSTTFNPPPVAGAEPAGQQEYLAAQEILKNRGNEAGLPEAVRLLWISVEKGNSNAEVALAELYRHGTGVAKSCDQTSILLTAAARKGNAEAHKRLEQFKAEGCE